MVRIRLVWIRRKRVLQVRILKLRQGIRLSAKGRLMSRFVTELSVAVVRTRLAKQARGHLRKSCRLRSSKLRGQALRGKL